MPPVIQRNANGTPNYAGAGIQFEQSQSPVAQAPAGWDPKTYANFKAANPNLEPTAEDTARMNGTYKPTTQTSGTVQSNANIIENVIPDNSAKLSSLSNKGSYQDAHGNIYYADGTSTPSTNVSESDLDNTPEFQLLNSAQSRTDSTTKSLIDSIKQQYDTSLIPQQQEQNTSDAAEVGNTLARYGASRTGSAGRAMGAVSTTGLQAIAKLESDENNAIAQAQQAQSDGDFKTAEDKIQVAQNLRTQKQAAAKDIYDTQQTAIAQNQKDVQSVLSAAAENGAPQDVLKAIQSSQDGASATEAAGGFLSSNISQDLRTFNYLKSNQMLPADISSLPEGDQYGAYLNYQKTANSGKLGTSTGTGGISTVGGSTIDATGGAETTDPTGADINSTIAAIARDNKLSAGTQTAISPILGVINAAQDLAESNPTGEFKGISPLNSVLDAKIPLVGIGLPFRSSLQSKEGINNEGYINGINLKVQQWASGASLTDAQTKQVEQMVPTKDDTDEHVQEKLNNLVNFMQQQIGSTLATNGIVYKPAKVDLFSGNKSLADIFGGTSSTTPSK